ncbi:MAG TPA: 3-hydroxyacyl-CoA dehydrogenase NAD-binding domain-containing protein [Chiayiivirga sp.]|nr:3-hydroxyacyl-CoA dehydrogenase NAD-binding domain-containing protein [Chiayiivirga sp.]
MPVHYSVRDAVALLTFENPPVNGFGLALRIEMMDALERAETDPGVRAVVLAGAGALFSGGADIREFDTPEATREPNLHTLIARVEGFPRPVVTALHGITLGGGLELALGAHYRVAHAEARLGLPEVKLGLLPGAGGTQRLPRAVGLETALDMIVSGEPRRAATLADTGLLDQVVEGDVVEAALEFARRLPEAPLPRLRDRAVGHPDAAAWLDFARGAVAAASGPYPAPTKCVDTLVASIGPFDAGLAFEREAFLALMQTPESRALRHAFFAERAAARVAGVGKDTCARRVATAGVVGAGTMGSGIAMCFLDAGIPVTLLEMGPEALERGVATIRGHYEKAAAKGRLDEAATAARMALLRPSLDYQELAGCDLLIEAVYEDMAVKSEVFRRLDAVARPGAILASNTSTLDLDRLAGATARPEDVVGLHFFSPAQIMRLLEVVRGARTSPEVLASAMKLARTIGKTAVVAGVCDGFIGNRMLEQYLRQACFLLDEGVLPEQVDRALEGFGLAMGPFRMADLAGNDIGWAIRKRRAAEMPDMVYSRSADIVCEAGRFGQKTGKGWYDYRPGERRAYPSPEVHALLARYCGDIGVPRREVSDSEIVERLLFALANEGAMLLEEGIAARASDIDVVYLSGYGFPRWRGGPMSHADAVGLYNVLAAIRRFQRGYRGEVWQPAPLLARLAASGGSFAGGLGEAAA